MGYNGKHLAQLSQELEAFLPQVSRRGGLGALSVAVDIGRARVVIECGRAGERILGAGRPLFSPGCVLDMLFAILCLEGERRGEFSIDEPFERFMPELAPMAASRSGLPITIRHLLTRTSGLQDPRTIEEMKVMVPWAGLAPRVQAAPALFSPGVAFSYGGVDRWILAILLERASGLSMGRLADQRIIAPCGIEHRPEQLGPPEPDGRLSVKGADTVHLALIAAALARGDDNGRGPPLAQAVREGLSQPQFMLSQSMTTPPWPHGPLAFTLGFFRYADGLIGFNGWDQGEACSVRYDPEAGLAFVVGLQGPPGARDYIVAEIAGRLGYESAPCPPKPSAVGGLGGLAPDEVVGRYQGWAKGYEADITLEGDRLACALSYDGHRFRTSQVTLDDDGWLIAAAGESLSAFEFFRDPGSGRVGFNHEFAPYAQAGA